MNIVPVTDPNDPRIAAFRDIRDRDLAGRDGLFVAEGKVVLDVLFTARRFAPLSALILENRLDGMRPVLAKAPAGMPVHVASGPVMDAIAGFHMHRGVLAVAARGNAPTPAALVAALPERALVVALVGIANHDNVGAIFRNAAAFGADAVLLDETCCDPLYRKAIRVSVGAALRVPFAMGGDAAALVDLLAGAGFAQFALSPAGETDIGRLVRAPRSALYFGTEGEGLPAGLMAAMRTVRIPIAKGFDSLNVAASSAVALHRLFEGG
jgi:tRNA G18 (ribose-2'-O)-methylase SpoU